MDRTEKILISNLEKRKSLIFFIVITALGIFIRFCGKDFISGDMTLFLIPWFDEIKVQGGIACLKNQVGDYNIPYQFLMAILTYIPISPVYLIKSISVIFDFVLAIATAQFVCEIQGKKKETLFLAVYTAIILLPTNIMNSSYWGQCDSIYVAFILLSLLFLFRREFSKSFIFLGAAFAFKLQTIFIFPFFLYYYFLEKDYSIFSWVIVLAVDYLICIPGFIMGRAFLAPIQIYFLQTNIYQSMYLNFPSFWGIVGNSYDMMKNFAIFFTIAILGCGLMYALENKIRLQGQEFVHICIWTVWTTLLFLPAMHERYSYLLDVLLIVLVFLDIKFIKISIAATVVSIMTYGNYLFNNGFDCRLMSIVYLCLYVDYTYTLIQRTREVSTSKGKYLKR